MSEHPTIRGRTSTVQAVKHHLAVAIACLALGGLVGWVYASSMEMTYTSTSRVLVNPSVGNPYAPTPAAVRQDELTSLQTEAQVARSAEVLRAVADQSSGLTASALERGVQINVLANTQILEISYSATDPAVAQQVADAVAEAYLDNRERRFDEVNTRRIERLEMRTLGVVNDLRNATAAAQVGSPAERLFERELAQALRNELVSLRAQRTALENLESPAGAVIAPASTARSAGELTATLIPAGGALAGLVLGCLLAIVLEWLAGVVRSVAEVEATGLPVVAAAPPPGWRARLFRSGDGDAVRDTIRRLRATILALEPRPDIITVAPAGIGDSDAAVSEAVAESFAKAGHRVVLVRGEGQPVASGLEIEERGLAQALLYERLNVLDLLQPSVEPLLCLLPDGGFTDQSRELLAADRLRAVLSPLVEAGHLVVIQSPGIDSAEGEAFAGAADLGLVVMTVGWTRQREVEQAARKVLTKGANLAALVIGSRHHQVGPVRRSRSARHARRAAGFGIASFVADSDAGPHDVESRREETVEPDPVRRERR